MTDLSPSQLNFLELLVRREALRFGDFTLKSGRKSPYFINTGCFHFGGDLAALGACYADAADAAWGQHIDIVFGPAYKGIPLALATAQALEERWGRPVAWTYDRKEAKDHGDKGSFVGAPLAQGARLLIVDDVMTAGTAIRESLAKLKDTPVQVVGALLSVDRQEPGKHSAQAASSEIAEEFGVPVYSILRMEQVAAYLHSHDVDGIRYLDDAAYEQIVDHLAR